MLNRKVAPPIARIRHIDVPDIETIYLDNGVPVTVINSGTEDIVKFEVVHKAGKTSEEKKLASRATASLMKEGCGPWNAETFAEKFDFYGAGLKTAANMDFLYSSVYTLGKYFHHIIEPLAVMYREPRFDVEELQNFANVNIQKLKEELTKNEVLSYRLITEAIFGSGHPYGYNSHPEDYLNLTREDVLHHFDSFIGTDNKHIFLSGRIKENVIQDVNRAFGQHRKSTVQKPYNPADIPLQHKILREDVPGDMQSSIKIGRRLFDRKHPDQSVFFVLNTILGGYFGSRLMRVLREEKGYTYDIASQMDQMLYDGCFYIGTEVSTANADKTIKEIYRQMDLLQQKKVGADELEMVKNYLAGTFLNMVDGPMQLSVVAKTLALIGLPFSALDEWIQAIMDMPAEAVQDCAQKYLIKDTMWEIVVG